MKPNSRENNYDLLRILSAVAVVFVHINQHYMAYPVPKNNMLVLCETIIEVFTRFCVPCFLMISGAFLLSNSQNKSYKSFYKHRFTKIVLPYLILNAGFLIYDSVFAIIEGKSLTALLKNYLTGYAYNLWFVPVITGLYLLTPIIIRFKESVTARTFGVVSGLWIILAAVFQLTTTYEVAWSFASVFSYLGYFMLGAVIYQNLRNRVAAFPFALIALGAFSLRVFLRMNNLTWIFRDKNVYFYPTIIIAAIAVFVFFSNIRVKVSLGLYARASLYVYLLHTFVFDLILKFFGDRLIINELLTIFIIAIISFTTSLIIGILITKRRTECSKK